MEKIISVNLAGRVLPIEEDAYVLLNHYFESLRTYFAGTEGAEEIVGDIESRVSEMLAEELRTGAPAVNVLHVSQVKARMGSAEDFRAADGGAPEPETNSYTKTPPPAGKSRSRFTRNSSDKMLGGVCSGVAAYFQIDPALVRVLFAVLTLGGWGTGILLYGALWAFTPEEALPAGLAGRRLYRDSNSRLGGVCAGLGAYFDKDPWLFRIIFLIPALGVLGSSNWGGGWGIFGGSLSFTIVVIYLLLWALLPEAKTPLQKEEMRGEYMDINRIREQVKDRATHFSEEVKTSAQRFTAQTKERFQQSNFQGVTAARQGAHVLGRVIRGIILFFGGILAFSLLILLLAYFFGGFSTIVNDFLLDSSRQRILVNLSLFLLLGAPFLALLVKLISSALRLPASRFVGLTFTLLWIGGIAIGIIAWSSVLGNFRSLEKVTAEVPVTQPAGKELTLAVPAPGIVYENTVPGITADISGWNVTPEAMLIGNVWIATEASPDSLFHLFVTRQSRGRNRTQARQLAQAVNYPITSTGSQIDLPASYNITRQQGFRGQMVRLRIQVPAGREVRFDPSVHQKLIVGGDGYWDFPGRNGGRRLRYEENTNTKGKSYFMNQDGELEVRD